MFILLQLDVLNYKKIHLGTFDQAAIEINKQKCNHEFKLEILEYKHISQDL